MIDPKASQSMKVPRRDFLRSASFGLASAMVAGAFRGFESEHSGEEVLSVGPGTIPGSFSIGYEGMPLIESIGWRIECEEGTATSKDANLEASYDRRELRYSDSKRMCDVVLKWKVEEDGTLIALTFAAVNVSDGPLRIKNIYPLISEAGQGGGLHFWPRGGARRALTDEWERCYGTASVVKMQEGQLTRSAWNMHFHDMEKEISCTVGYYAIPNTKVSITTMPTVERTSLSVRCDSHAGMRGVLVRSGQNFTVNEFMVRVHKGTFFHSLESYAVAVARRNRIQPPAATPTGWVDWYFAKAQATEEDMLRNLDFIASELKDYGLEYIQIDSGWQVGVETTPPPHNVIAGGPWRANSRFPRGMRWLADEIRKRGLKPGIWVRPFHSVEGSDERRAHPEWFNKEGQMDFSHPSVRKHVADIFTLLAKEWGYEYVKYDFPAFDLYGAWGPKLFEDASAHAELHDPEHTTIEAYRASLESIFSAVAGRARLLACNSLMPPTLGVSDVFRIGDDVGDWTRTFKFGVRSVSARYYTNGIFWANDPDCLLVREPFTIDQARMWASLITLSGGVVFISENLPLLPVERLGILKKTLPVYRNGGDGYGFGRPLDLLENDPPRIWHFEVKRPYDQWHVVGLFNWSEVHWKTEIPLKKFALDDSLAWHVSDFWPGRYRGERQGSISVSIDPNSCQVLALREKKSHPQVLSTSRHVLQGAVELSDVAWNARRNELRGTANVIKGDSFEILIFAGDRAVKRASHPFKPSSSEPGILRLSFSPDQTSAKEWSIAFH
jgi:hypothetical protein